MAFMGEISDIGVSDLLYLLALRQQSGRLSVVANGDEVSIFINRGRMVLIQSSNASLRLGRMLVRLDYISNDRLREALKHQEQRGTGHSLGTILIEEGFITEPQLFQCIEEQCIEVLSRIIAAETGVFVFHMGERVSPRTEIVPLNADRIMLEATRRTDELSALRALLPDSSTPLTLSNLIDELADHLSDVEVQIASALYGNPMSLHDLAMVVTIEDTTLWRAVVSMRERGIIVVASDQNSGRETMRTHASAQRA